MKDKSGLSRKIVLMSGGSSRLGQIIVRHLVKRGYKVYAGFNSSGSILESKNVTPVKLDVTSSFSCRNAVNEVVRKEKNLDILINVAGLTKVGRLENSNLNDFETLLDINVKGAYRLIKEVLPYMEDQKHGKIINISSLSGLVALPNFGIYSASKFALEALTNSLRYEVFGNNISVTNVEPGAIESDPKSSAKMPHKTFREKYPLVGKLLPLVKSSDVAVAVERILETKNPPVNILVGRDVKLVYTLKKFSPSFLWDILLKFIWRK